MRCVSFKILDGGKGWKNLKVKLVPRLGPFMTSKVSKNAVAASVEWNVTENKPP